jgi:hypothetical protein
MAFFVVLDYFILFSVKIFSFEVLIFLIVFFSPLQQPK